MAEMGKFCKAYLVEKLRQFPGWQEKPASLRPTNGEADVRIGKDGSLDGADFLYLQENYTVTDGIFKDEYIVFDNVTAEWKEFCDSQLEFAKAQSE